MDGLVCSLHALIACFSWSNLYIDGGLSYQDATELPYAEWRTHVNRLPGAIETVTQLETFDDPFNPYGRIAFGYDFNFRTITISAEAFYRNSFDDDYPGQAVKGIGLKARWYLFRH